MSAILVPTAVAQATLPSAIYDKLNRMITVTVIVSLVAPDVYRFQIPIITIKGPQQHESALTWTVGWTFVGESSGSYKIQFTPKVNTILPRQLGPGLLLLEIEPVPSLTAYNYDIVVGGTGVSQVDDPTIVVTPDPIVS